METIILDYGKTVCGRNWHVLHNNENFIRIYYVFSGDTLYKDENTTFNLLRNQLYVFLKNSYEISHNPDIPLDVLWFHIIMPNIKPSEYKNINISENTLEYHLLKTLEKSIESNRKITEELIKLFINYLDVDFGLFDYYDDDIINALTVIHENLDKNITNAQIAKILNYSEKYFISFFKKRCGISPQKYIKAHKMDLAASYLKDGFSLKEIADRLGYCNTNNFCRDFKLRYKISPIKYISERVIKP